MHPFLTKSIFFHRRFLAENILILSAILLFLFFPKRDSFEKILGLFLIYGVFPLVFLKIILRKPLREYGLHWGSRNLFSSSVAFLGALGIFSVFSWWFASHTEIGREALLGENAFSVKQNFLHFLLLIIALGTLLLPQEFFFRGFLLLSWKRVLGRGSIFVHSAIVVSISFIEIWILAGNHSFGPIILTFCWTFLASLLAFFTESIFLSFCFSLFSVIILSTLSLFLV